MYPLIAWGIEGLAESIYKELKQNGPYDGILGFSSGSVAFRTLYRIYFDFDKERYHDIQDFFSKISYKCFWAWFLE
jgi:hypothetical protein